MTKDAFCYAVRESGIALPENALWIYGDTGLAHGSAYSPMFETCKAYEQRGIRAIHNLDEANRRYDAVIVNCPQNREETSALLAFALERSTGLVMATARNDTGGQGLKKLFSFFDVEILSLSKHHCKVVWTLVPQGADKQAISHALVGLQPFQVEHSGRTWWSMPGVFGWNKKDIGSALLCSCLPENLKGRAADFGCGYGYLAANLLEYHPGITQLDAYDHDHRAVELTIRNTDNRVKGIWADITSLAAMPAYDVIVMNPPFHSGKQSDSALGLTFIQKAFLSLKQGGQLFMVANHFLPYEGTLPSLRVINESNGFKVMHARRP